jgi:hypothetical protein
MATVDPYALVKAAVPTLEQITEPEVGPTGLTRVHVLRGSGEEVGRYLLNEAGDFVGGNVTDAHAVLHPATSIDGLCALLLTLEALR